MRKVVSTATGIFVIVTLALIAGSLIWWQSELAEAEGAISTLRVDALNQ